jgi:hypothetical protein
MKTRTSSILTRQRALLASLALGAAVAFGAAQTAQAAPVGTTADATILNVVHVTYKDASNTQSFEATAKTTVTVNLVKAALNPTAPPVGGDGSLGFTCPAPGSFESGSTASYLYALTAAANGDDTYKLSIATPSSTNVDVPSIAAHYYVLDYLGGAVATDPATHLLGSATPIGVKDDTTLYFPGGALAGFQDNDIVIVNLTTGGKKAYLVNGAPVVGNAAGHTAGTKTNAGAPTWSDTAEVKGELKLKAFPITTITLNTTNDTTYGGTVAPTFTTNAPVTGEPVGEMILVKVSVTATVNVSGADGTVTYSLTTKDSANGNSLSIPTAPCPAGNFLGTGLSITKQVRLTPAGTFGATATGNPGEILEYQLTVTNNKGKANDVKITDAVPPYTTLVITGGNFATITDDGGATSVTVTTAVDTETAPQPHGAVETGFGNIVGTGAAGDPIKFFIGDTSSNSTGGTVNNGSTYVIKYQVKID